MSFLLKNAFKRRKMLVLALVSQNLHIPICLHVSQCFHCVKTDNVFNCAFPSALIAIKPIMCKKCVFSAKERVLTHLTWFLLKNAFKQRQMLVLALFGLILHNSMRLHVSQCFHCDKSDNVQKTRF